jgi:hypothetical protein
LERSQWQSCQYFGYLPLHNPNFRVKTYFDLVNFQANGRTAPAATALIASPIKNGTTPFAIAQTMVFPVV